MRQTYEYCSRRRSSRGNAWSLRRAVAALVVSTIVSVCGGGVVLAIGEPVDLTPTEIQRTYSQNWGSFGEYVDVSPNGLRIAVSSHWYCSVPSCSDARSFNNGDVAGRVDIFELRNGIWDQVGNPLIGAAGDELGTGGVAFSQDGTRIAVGSPGAEGGNGRVQVFDDVDGTWTLHGAMVGSANEGLGQRASLSYDGDRLAVSSAFYPGRSDPTSVKVYDLSGGTWVQVGSELEGAVSGQDFFGRSLQLSANGSRLVVSAPWARSIGANIEDYAGSVKVFEYQTSDWIQLGDTFTGDPSDDFGYAVSISGDGNRIAIGRPRDYSTAVGNVSLLEWTGGVWTLLDEVSDPADDAGTLGFSVSLSYAGDRLVAGAPFAVLGHVDVFELVDGNLVLVERLLGDEPPTAVNDGAFGVTVALAARGNRLIVGAPFWDDAAGGPTRLGKVVVFDGLSLLPDPAIALSGGPGSPLLRPDGSTPEMESGTGEILEGASWDQVSSGPSEVGSELVRIENSVVLQPVGGQAASDDYEIRLRGACNGVECVVETRQQPDGSSREVMHLQSVDGSARASGAGFAPGTEVELWLFSDPKSLGSALVASDGTFDVVIPLDDVDAGEHTLQANGVTADLVARTANIGVVLDQPQSRLPATGINLNKQLLLGVLMVILGASAVVARRLLSPRL